jgi:phosphoribosylformimino-5-aminoimidazole carboxamide ribotide isomerase
LDVFVVPGGIVLMQLLPAIDLRRGGAVRLRQGDDARATLYGDDPRELLRRYAQAGVRRVHLVDLDAALGEAPQRELIAELAALPGAPALQLGGGLRDRDAVVWAFEAGCERAVLGSLVAREPDLFASLAEEFPGRLVPALDVEAGEVRIAGWREGAGRSLDEICAGLRGLSSPAVLVTDVSRDGMMEGPNLDLARRVARASGLPALLSGGIRSLANLEAARAFPEIAGAIVGRALYENAFTTEAALAVCAGGAA